METRLKMVYWKGEKFWVGKLIDHPEVMTQGKTLEELEENIIEPVQQTPSPHVGIMLVEVE